MDDGLAFDPLLAAAEAGAAWAFDRLYRELSPAVAGYLRVQGAAEPDDLTSDVFFKVFTGMASFAGDAAQFRSWVFTIAHHRLVDERRHQARHPAPAGLEAAGERAAGDAEDDALAGSAPSAPGRCAGPSPQSSGTSCCCA